jgi:hypothetical protein
MQMRYNCNCYAEPGTWYHQTPLPPFGIVIMKTVSYKHYIEILPAALLAQPPAWRRIVHSLPNGTCLLITNPRNVEQTKLMNRLIQLFHKKGRQAVLCTAKGTVIP